MSSRDLERALREAGIGGVVTSDGAIAVLHVPAGDRTLGNAELRQRAVALASAHGFRSLALEVSD